MSERLWGWLWLLLCASVFCWRGGTGPAWWGLSAAAWLLLLLVPGPLRLPSGTGAWAAWAAWGGLCLLHGREPWRGLSAWWSGVTCILFFLMPYSLWSGRHRRVWILGLWGAAAACVAALASGLAAWLTREIAACLLAAAFSGAWTAWTYPAREDSRWSRPAGWAALLAWAGLLLIGNWAAFFGVLVPGVLCAVLGRGWRSSCLWIAAVAVLGSSLALSTPPPLWAYASWWRAAYGLAKARPLLGTGAEAMSRLWPSSGPGMPGWLELPVETGVLGAGLFCWALWMSLPGRLGNLTWEGRASAAAFFAMLTVILLDRGLGSPVLNVALFSSLACAQPDPGQEEPDGRDRPRPVWICLLGLVLCLAAPLPHLLVRGWRKTRPVDLPEERVRRLAWSLRLAPADAEAWAHLAWAHLKSVPARPGAALLALDRAITEDPANPLYLGQRAELFATVGGWDRTEAAARRALALEPGFSQARLLLAEALLAKGDAAASAREFIEAERSRAQGLVPRALAVYWDAGRHERVGRVLERLRAR